MQFVLNLGLCGYATQTYSYVQTEHLKLNEFIDLAIIAASVSCAMNVLQSLYMDEIHKTTILCLKFFGNAFNEL